MWLICWVGVCRDLVIVVGGYGGVVCEIEEFG